MSSQKLKLYTADTPNGYKLSITLEELGLPYDWQEIHLSKQEQKEDWFLKINPNGRIPAMVDGDNVLFESGAMMLYLVEKYDKDHKLSFADQKEHYDMLCWLFFQNAGLGPMQGQSNHFVRYAPEKIKYGMDRYINETRRLYRVIDARLREQNREYIVGAGKGKLSIADIATFPWVHMASWSGVDIEEFPHLKAWHDRINARPAVYKGLGIPQRTEYSGDDRHIKEVSNWVMEGQKGDAARK